MHPLLSILPELLTSPALPRICPDAFKRPALLSDSLIQLRGGEGQFAWVDVIPPGGGPAFIVLSDWYYRNGWELDLYLDLIHELTHLRQLHDGWDLWDQRFPYVDRPTEIEGFAVAVEEGRRQGWSEVEVRRHLHNPWMSAEDVSKLLVNIDRFLSTGILLNESAARTNAAHHPIRVW